MDQGSRRQSPGYSLAGSEFDLDEWVPTSDKAKRGVIDILNDRLNDFPRARLQAVAAEALDDDIPAVWPAAPALVPAHRGFVKPSRLRLPPPGHGDMRTTLSGILIMCRT